MHAESNSIRVLVDADACPRQAMAVLRRLEPEYGFELMTISSFNHHSDEPGHIVVGDDPQATDIALMNRVRPGDIAVTQDWGLAALVLAKGAGALSPAGQIYEPGKIDFLLEERHLKAKFRRGGGRTKGPSARTADDDRRFENTLRSLLEK
ncbi:MAG: DUF188 domain-containing protein [Firmicutes bacterium]|nr:DUF188 domain-containing protein [Bacillota bacterium]